MSRGPGKIQRAIADAFRQNPSATYAVDDLAVISYPGLNKIEKKHRVAVVRAADAVAKSTSWCGQRAERPGHQLIYYNLLDLRSYATGKMRVDFLSGSLSDAQITKALSDPKADWSRWDWVQPGGVWWQHVEINKARAEGRHAEADAMDVGS